MQIQIEPDHQARVNSIINQLGNLTPEQIKELESHIIERYSLSPHDAKKAVADFIIQIQEPTSILQGILTCACLSSSFGRHISFILDSNSTAREFIITMIGSLATGALAVDSVSDLPPNIKEHWQSMSGLKKAGIAIYLALLTMATASDAYRVGAEASKVFGLAAGIPLGTFEGVTIFGVGTEALKCRSSDLT
ncbi:hypothetical protein [Endozoicomonas sp.]|uniref:hypothetical protein n=1 Tax=Endozoicomonas sp. TaxID=1892382 RepID=UPI003AF9A6EB